MLHHVYVLKSSKDGKLYIGYTSNLDRRIQEHKNGLVTSTKNRRPLELVYVEEFKEKANALQREKYFKGGGKARALLKNKVKWGYGETAIMSVSKTVVLGSSPSTPADEQSEIFP
jgi:putative endonuclease